MASNPEFSLAAKRQIVRAVRRTLAQPDDYTDGLRPSAPRHGKEWFWAKINDSTAIDGEHNRWTYSFTEQKRTADGWEDEPDGRTGDALNSVEWPNTETGIQGNSADLGDDGTADEVIPVRGNPVVVMFVGYTDDPDSGAETPAYSFAYENADTGATCPGDEREPTSLDGSGGGDAAATTSWSKGTDPHELFDTRIVRVVYNSAGDQKLYGFLRTYTYQCGTLVAVSAETRITIDAPDLCSS